MTYRAVFSCNKKKRVRKNKIKGKKQKITNVNMSHNKHDNVQRIKLEYRGVDGI